MKTAEDTSFEIYKKWSFYFTTEDPNQSMHDIHNECAAMILAFRDQQTQELQRQKDELVEALEKAQEFCQGIASNKNLPTGLQDEAVNNRYQIDLILSTHKPQ